MLIIPNAVALLMPSWVRFDKNAPRGFENFGQAVILVIGQMFVLIFAMLPAGLIFWLTLLLAGLVFGPAIAAPLAALAAAAVFVAEGAAAIYRLGAAFERFDLSAEMMA
jgi:FtsH-binding integral membrane protein